MFNAHWGVGRTGRDRARRFDVAEAVRSLDADVVVVPESFRTLDGDSVLDPLVAEGYGVEQIPVMRLRAHSGFDDLRPQGNWELAVCSRLPVLACQTFSIGRAPRDPAGERFALAVTVEIGAAPFTVVGLHASSKVWYGAPIVHLRNLATVVAGLSGQVVVAGDCNFWGPGVVTVMRGWRRAVRGRTYPAHRPHSQIDHILVRPEIEVVSAEVRRLGLSDHRAVRAVLRFPTVQEPTV